jgi:hypothetical protein
MENNRDLIFGSVSNSLNIQECPICYTYFSIKDNIATTVCKHIFHKDCILSWLKIKKNCPCCRRSINLPLLNNFRYRNIEIMEETEYYFFIKILKVDYGIPVDLAKIDKSTIELIFSQLGQGESILKIIYTFIKNNKNILDTIMELSE